MGNALAEQLLAVRPEETHQGREADEPLLMVVVALRRRGRRCACALGPRRSRPGHRWLRLRPRRCRASRLSEPPSVERTRAPLSPHASTWRTSPPSSTVKPVLLPMKVANSRFLLSSTPFRVQCWVGSCRVSSRARGSHLDVRLRTEFAATRSTSSGYRHVIAEDAEALRNRPHEPRSAQEVRAQPRAAPRLEPPVRVDCRIGP